MFRIRAQNGPKGVWKAPLQAICALIWAIGVSCASKPSGALNEGPSLISGGEHNSHPATLRRLQVRISGGIHPQIFGVEPELEPRLQMKWGSDMLLACSFGAACRLLLWTIGKHRERDTCYSQWYRYYPCGVCMGPPYLL